LEGFIKFSLIFSFKLILSSSLNNSFSIAYDKTFPAVQFNFASYTDPFSISDNFYNSFPKLINISCINVYLFFLLLLLDVSISLINLSIMSLNISVLFITSNILATSITITGTLVLLVK
jgi:hypothetical protein